MHGHETGAQCSQLYRRSSTTSTPPAARRLVATVLNLDDRSLKFINLDGDEVG
jgi:hypothetical protein